MLERGLDFVIFVQQFRGPHLDTFFRTVTSLGDTEFYLVFLPLLFWCINYALGGRVSIVLMLSAYLTIFLKVQLQFPRPFDLDPNVQVVSEEGYGFPSGHALLAVVVWGSVAMWTRRIWFWIPGIILMILIGFSRIYLGVHFPTDVIAGWILGVILLYLYWSMLEKLERWITEWNLSRQVFVSIAFPVLMVLNFYTFASELKMALMTIGTLAGISAGIALNAHCLCFRVRGSLWRRTFCVLFGVVIVFVLYSGLKSAYPAEGIILYPIFSFLHFGLIGLWVSFGAPWFFLMIKILPERRSNRGCLH